MTLEQLIEKMGEAHNFASQMAITEGNKEWRAYFNGKASAYLIVLNELLDLEKVNA